ncbi:MAG: NAD(P)H-dependent oxidoreductase subunit E [Candidatus Aminicenantes bacterium]|nr:MAG: NAD(P)H-dependent oxidoreductase subunit E [Candidatus Aminicenantes bacterium]
MLAENSEIASQEDMEALEEIYRNYSNENSVMIYLQQIQSKFGYVPAFSMRYITEKTNVSGSHIYGVVTFYAQFSTKPVGKNIVKMCKGTACHVGGSKVLAKKLRSYLNLDEQNDTTEDRLFTIQNVACLGCCALAPSMMVNGKAYGNLNVDKIKEIIETYRKLSDSMDL